MFLPVILFFVAILLLMLFMSLRISIELTAKSSGITYTVKGSIFKYIKIVEVKSGTKKQKRQEKDSEKKRERILDLIRIAINGKIFHIEKLSLSGTFSINDAAANAVLYGTFLTLWQFIIILLSANFKLEHQNYSFYPDFQNDKNELIFQLILRVVILKALSLIINYYLESKTKINNN
ncbi:MAG: DUF2953 domain-containing protein [Clostridiaceae bacterium]|nr:DUF2953 domain-containing protein [Clostridiaceae bacterium]